MKTIVIHLLLRLLPQILFFSAKFDTVTLVRDCVHVRLVKRRDTIRLTITKPSILIKPVKVPVKFSQRNAGYNERV